MEFRYNKSWLYAPATNMSLVTKSLQSQADVAVFDLEDSITLNQKEQARLCLQEGLYSVSNKIKTAIRINSVDQIEFYEDIDFLYKTHVRFDYLIFPKADDFTILGKLYNLLSQINPNLKIYPLIETASGIDLIRNASVIPEYIGGLLLGSADLNADLGFHPVNNRINWMYEELVFCARKHGIEVCDSPCMFTKDNNMLRKEISLAKDIGFTGKQAIHPSHISLINEGFSLSQDELSLLTKTQEASTQIGVTAPDGVIYGPPVVRYVRKLMSNII